MTATLDTVRHCRARHVCEDCGGTNVSRDAWARWNARTLQWELAQVFDEAFCHDCERATKLRVEVWKFDPAP